MSGKTGFSSEEKPSDLVALVNKVYNIKVSAGLSTMTVTK